MLLDQLCIHSDVTVELPFTLTHPKPPDEMMASAVARAPPPGLNHAPAAKPDDSATSLPVDPNLIHIDTRSVTCPRGVVSVLLFISRVLQSLYRFQPYDCVIVRFVE